MKIDKSKWKTYRFEEFAQNISQRVEPQSTDLDIYVGLEHLDPDSLHIKRYGSPSSVEGTKLKFYKGNIIFGKRRAYQRKAALAECDGICSAHAMVLRAKTDFIDERLFPFFFHAKVFQTRAVNISVGGLSPTINWKDLAKQEFLLPPKEEQARLAELLWAADEVVEREKEVKERLNVCRQSLMKEQFVSVKSTEMLSNLPIKEINGLWKTDENVETIDVNIIRSTEFAEYGNIHFETLETMPVKVSQYGTRKLYPNDIIIERSGGGPEQPVGRVCFFEKTDGEYSFSNFTSCIRILDEKKIKAKYLFYYLQFIWEMKGTDRIQNQTTGIRNLDYKLYKRIRIPICPITILR
ncbi:hypothetical protein EZS27_026311 [termite gut metagenome]|uniref:Type I restriction modification DNA specificity domain-containing protein n=1 Tax=termite gut metagenome TaxID=433724 RepID=A0A5J4QTW9_9ZZZZ